MKEVQVLEEVGFVLAAAAQQVGVYNVERVGKDVEQFVFDRRRVFQQSDEQVKHLHSDYQHYHYECCLAPRRSAVQGAATWRIPEPLIVYTERFS